MSNPLHKIEYGLYALSTKNGDKDNACIVNTFMQLSSNSPTTASVAVSKASLTHDMIIESGLFNVSVIAIDASFDFFERLGLKSGRTTNKFADCKNIYRSTNGIIFIKRECNAYFSLKVTNAIDVDTHTLFIGKIQESKHLSHKPSMTYSHYHANIKPQPKEANKMGYRCTICNYVLKKETLPTDFICPLCSHGADDFEKINN